jgi:hypothetical protein
VCHTHRHSLSEGEGNTYEGKRKCITFSPLLAFTEKSCSLPDILVDGLLDVPCFVISQALFDFEFS